MPVIRDAASELEYASFSLPDVEQEAAGILEDARSRATAILEQSRQDGHREGFNQGLAEGRELARREALDQHAAAIAQVVSALDAALRDVQATRETLISASAQDATRLAIAIASKVCGQMAMGSRMVAEHNVSAALRLIGRGREVRLCVHPSDAEHLHSILPELQRRNPTLVSIDLAADAGVEPGGCRVHTCEVMIDAGIQTQLDRIAAELLGEPGGTP